MHSDHGLDFFGVVGSALPWLNLIGRTLDYCFFMRSYIRTGSNNACFANRYFYEKHQSFEAGKK